MPVILCCQKKLISVWTIILKLVSFLRKCTCSRMTIKESPIIWHMVSMVAETTFRNRSNTISWILKLIKFMFSTTSQFYLTYCLDLFYPYSTLGSFREESWDLQSICRFIFESTVASWPTIFLWLYFVWDDIWFSLLLSRGWWQKQGLSKLQRALPKMRINALS